MRGDESCVAGLHETATMSSILGLPTRGSDVTILITKVHLHPLCVLVEFWGKFGQEKTAEYESLARDIQSPGNTFQEFEGNPGDQCLAHIDGTWHRSRIVSRNGLKYSVFLIDKGMTYSTTTSNLAWGRKKHFHLPPEVEYCVLANVLPLSPDNRWSPTALEFLKSLSGKSVEAHVQDTLVAHRTFLLHVPRISRQMYEMGFAKKLSPDMFQDFVLMTLQSHGGAEVSPETRRICTEAGDRLHKQQLFMYPELLVGTVETVIVTDVTNPQRIFCQLKVFSKELKKLSDQITQCCEGRMTKCIIGPEMIGFPCAARGSDGRWYRSVLQQVFPTSKVVEVLNVDYGTKQFVQVENVRPLAAEFFRMPVVTYICSLYGILDKGVGWTSGQIDYLRTLLLNKTAIAKFEYQSVPEGVYYVTFYGDENANINNLFGSKESCLLECEKTLGDYAIRSTTYSRQPPAQQKRTQTKMLTPAQPVEKNEGKGRVQKLAVEDLSLSSSHVAVVQHTSDPSEFWIQTQNHVKELDDLMDGMYHLYKDSGNKYVVRNPTVGLYCAAKAQDGDFYRATVTEVGETQTKVFFVDYGNTEVVDKSNIRTLPDEFRRLPCLALRCSLADIRPKDGRWSQRACEFFIRAVKDKTLNVHVVAKDDEGYVVQLTDPEEGDRDHSTLMLGFGLAEKAETPKQPKTKMAFQPASLAPTQLPDSRPSDVFWNNGVSVQKLNPVGPAGDERRIPTFKEHMFPIGSVLDVSVSYIESPNDFWCQLVQNAGHLKLLMHNIQAHYANSEFQSPVETACVARHPDNGMWYRALVIHKHGTPHVDVLFVDYGQTETVSLYDLRRICPEFLTLRGQAFRCSLLNPVDPTSATNEWDEEAIARFHSFVEIAASNFVILKCTIYAVMYSEQKIVFNIVDLETPFESVSTSMTSLVKRAPPKKGQSFRLDTYYYSTHNVKTGTEEQVTVTCVDNVGQFYCQLERNADVIKDLKNKVNGLCKQLENVKLPTVCGTLCFAKYTDGQWYRGQIRATKPAFLVHFVDYGDTIEVEKSDLLPVPREANDIMSVPVQAVVCSLSDVPADVPGEVNCWFEANATECKFRALVVAREPDGKLLVELYHGKTQINSKLKTTFQIEMHTGERVVHPALRTLQVSANHTQRTPKAVEPKDHTPTIKKNVSTPKVAFQTSGADMNLKSASKPLHQNCENGQRVKAAPLELYRPPHQRQSCGRTTNGSELAGVDLKPRKESLPTETEQPIRSSSPGTESQTKSEVEKLPELADLPSKSITSGLEVDVYVSHCNSPLSFYVQFVREEDELFNLVGQLNVPQSTPQTSDLKDLRPGDLVQAEFADDSSWYRAVVREIHNDLMALVEFIDFGNMSLIPVSRISSLGKSFLQLPMYSTHCMLSDAAALGKDKVLDSKLVSAFKENIGGNEGKVLKCKFIRQSGSVWEVSLEDDGMNVTCKVPTKCSTDGFASERKEQVKEQPAQTADLMQTRENPKKFLLNSSSLCYHQQDFLEGQKFEVYITSISDPQTFWCQPADSEELARIASRVSEIGDAVDHKPIDPDALSPGSPCVTLFSEDQFWYRAEVIDKDGDKLSVLFVDYGNTSQVSVADVREMPTSLIETPPQAFLCELEGFDASHGSWESSAIDMLSVLTTDKVFQLTVTRVTMDRGKIKCFVRMECEDQVINETMKTWWRSSTMENKPVTVAPVASNEAPVQCDSNMNNPAPPTDQLKNLESPEMDTAVACICPQRDDSEDQSTGELVDLQTADEVPRAASCSGDRKNSEDSLQSESLTESPEERTRIVSEPNMATGPEMLRATENLRQTVSNEGLDIIPTAVVCQTKSKDNMPCDGETMVPPLDNSDDQSILTLSVVETDDEGAPVVVTFEPGVLSSPWDGNPTAVIDDSQISTTDLISLYEEVDTYLTGSIFDIMNFSDLNEQRHDDSEVTIAQDRSCSMTTVTMVPREAAGPTTDERSEDLEQILTELVLTSCGLPGFDATEQEIGAGDGVPIEEVPCAATHVETDLMAEEEILARNDDTCSALLAESGRAASEPHTCTAPSHDPGDDVEELTCSVEEACLTDVLTDPDEPSEDSSAHNCVIGRHIEEMVQNELPLPHEQLIALLSDAEPQANRDPCPDLSDLVEEVTCLVGEICLTDICRDPQRDAETEDSERLVQVPSNQTEDFSDGVLEEKVSSFADDTFEAQLAKITHLALIINDGAADVLPLEQQPIE